MHKTTKGQLISTKLARRASTSGGNWPEGKSGLIWSEGPVHQNQIGPKVE